MDELNNAIPQAQETETSTVIENPNQGESNAQQPTDSIVPQPSESPKMVKVKHLHEEKEIDPFSDEAKSLLQMGMDYSRVKGKYEESKPVLSFVERIAKQNNMSVPEYLQAVEQYERQQEIEELATQRSLDPELAEELYLLRKERQEREMQAKTQAEQAKNQQEYVDFLQQFPEVKPESIPKEVWEIKASNPQITITDAFIRHEYNQLKAKVVAQETNTKNAESATGSVTGNGGVAPDFISADVYEQNKSDQSWVNKNFKKIMESRRNW